MFDVACYCTQSRRLSRSLTEAYDRALRPTGLTVAQFSLLRTLGRLETPTIGAISEATGLDRTTLGRNLAVMQRSGWVAVGPGEDGRTRLARPTKAGRAALVQAVPIWEQAQAETEAKLPEHVREALKEATELLAA